MGTRRSVAVQAAWAGSRLFAAPKVVILGLIAVALASPIAVAQAPKPNPFEANSSDQVRKLAIRGIPLDKFDPSLRARVESILTTTSVFRRLPVRVVECHPEMYSFLMNHPDVIVNIWRVLGVTQLEARETGAGRYEVADHVGTSGTIELIYQTQDTHIALAEGRYEGAMSLRPAKGRCLLVFKTGYVHETDGRYYITTRLDSFLSIEPGAAELVTRILQPVVGKVADNNFTQSIAFLGSMSRTAEVNPRGVERLSNKLTEVQPANRQGLAAIARRIGDDYANAAAPAEGPAQTPAAAADNAAEAPLPSFSRVPLPVPSVAGRSDRSQE
jgi:hypothetical protein